MADAPRRFADNPFLVLGVRPEQPRVEIEREGQKLLGMLELGLRSAATYMTPSGPRARTQEAVRAALAELRAPEKRLMHELWASLPQAQASAGKADGAPGDPYRGDASQRAPDHTDTSATQPGFAGAFALFGWRRP
ncbi:MAG: hypothetical protein R3A79_14650 [Nannocystaceae bacterium]